MLTAKAKAHIILHQESQTIFFFSTDQREYDWHVKTNRTIVILLELICLKFNLPRSNEN